MNLVWDGISVAESTATAASGLANAGYFAGRAARAAGPRRAAALLLVLLCGGAAVDAVAQLAGGESGAMAALVRLPSMLGNVATLWLVTMAADR